MSFDYSTLITNRARSDSDTLKTLLSKPMAEWTAEERTAFNGAVMRGSYDYTDLNRVNACLDDLVARLSRVGCNVPGYQRVKIERETKPASRLPEGYTEVQYIQSSGTQYVDTGFKPNQNSRVVIDAQLLDTSGYPALLGVRSSNTKMFWLYANTASQIVFGYGSVKPTAACTMSDRLSADANKNVLTVNGSALIAATASTFTAVASLYLFAANNAGTLQYAAKMFLYSCQIYDNGTMIRDYVPCISPAGAVGLYDLVGQEFYSNAGTGSFTAGESVTWPEEPNTPLDDLDPYTWYESDVPTVPLLAQYRSNVAAVRAVLRLPEWTPGVPETMRRLTPAAANSIEAVLLALDVILNNLPAAVRHCGVTTCGSKGVIA